MDSGVLYRKWRPVSFSDVMGQEAIVQTLKRAVATGRVAHAYLFCGPRGTGKTTTARILAKAVNCPDRAELDGEPCGQCLICKGTDEGHFVDLIEIDAASNRGIDDMRSLREKVQFAPSQGSRRVYIVDEAHMLTVDAVNAFLKTLEEPPPHTIFILCTTEAHKLLPTIISRCQRFDFRKISSGHVVERLRQISVNEGVETPEDMLKLLARASGGSLRDAVNLLDQLMITSGGEVSPEEVREMLGMGDEAQAVQLAITLLQGQTTVALDLINQTTIDGKDLRSMYRMLLECFRVALLAKSRVHQATELSEEARATIVEALPGISLKRVLDALDIFSRITIQYDQFSPLPLEYASVKLGEMEKDAVVENVPLAGEQVAPVNLASAQEFKSNGKLGDVPAKGTENGYSESVPGTQKVPTAAEVQVEEPLVTAATIDERNQPVDEDPAVTPPGTDIGVLSEQQWEEILRGLKDQRFKRFYLGALLRSSKAHHLDGADLVVRFAHRSNSERLQEELEDPRCRTLVGQTLESILGYQCSLKVETEGNTIGLKQGGQGGHLVRAAINMGGHVVPEPHAPEDPWERNGNEQEYDQTATANDGPIG